MIVNLSKLRCLARRPYYAVSWSSRLRGMIGRNFDGADFDAMVFNHCNSIHTLFMSRPIDVLFVDRENNICGLRRGLPPWVPMVYCRTALVTVELPAGTIDSSRTEIGDKVDLNSELTHEAIRELQAKELGIRGAYHCSESEK